MIRLVLFLLLGASMAQADPVKDWIAAQDEPYRWVLDAIHGDPSFMDYTRQCPADVFRGSNRYGSGSMECADNAGWCLMLCQGGSGDACFGLARFMETEMDDIGEATLKFPLFMASCAGGNANGCTNAGASAKNGSWIDGTGPDVAATPACQYRSYDAACATGASWGCFMLGVEWAFEGVNGEVDDTRAQTAWGRACTLEPDGGACDASRGYLETE